ncbi:MAG TPA: hypothetical protein VMM78_09835 [Thermomicrobiales bacterium]|nr:hypothetical protein [Thermomicrobiales bacterium]
MLFLSMLLVVPMMNVLSEIPTTQAAPAAAEPFGRAWARTDLPVASGAVSRTWMWGPEAFTDGVWEDYAEAPGGTRQVQYFDKSRMEITNPNAPDDGVWHVTNGLLVVELMTGRMQTGDQQFTERAPAAINVAGDPDDPLTYAVLAQRRFDAPQAVGAAVTQRINASGQVSSDPALAGRGVTATTLVAETNHTVASVFWDFMHASGPVQRDGQTVTDKLFVSPFYATGLPVTEPFWAQVKIGGTPRELLLQCFERRCLTYAPENPPGWQVEAGNVGLHYHAWRYGQTDAEPGPSPLANELAEQVRVASTADERYVALLAVMDTLHVGIYAQDGTKVLGGAERGAADFYLYDFELRMMAEALERGQTWGVADLAMQLAALGYVPEGHMLDPALVHQAIVNGVAAAKATPGEFTSLSPLLLRQLGLRQSPPHDLFASPALEQTRFDALGYFLLLSELTIPAIADELPQAAADSNLIAESNGVLKAADASTLGVCDPSQLFNGDAFKDAWGWTKIFTELLLVVPETVASVTAVIDAVHGSMLAYSVSITELDQRLETHYGHDGEGDKLTFRVKAEMLDDVSPALVDCGWIAGATFPPKGPIQGMSVHWFWGGLEQHGTVDCGKYCPSAGGNGLSIDATGPDGIASMTFTPYEEVNPGEGWVVEEHGIVTGVGLYQSKFTNLLGSYAQYLTPKSGATRWVVERHAPPGWDVKMTLNYDVDSRWRHIGYYKSWEYFEEDANGSGTITFNTYIPFTAAAVDGFQDFALTGIGHGSAVMTSTEHSEVGAFWHWEQNCASVFNTEWVGVLGVNEIYADANGVNYVDIYKARAPYWHQLIHSGTRARGSACPGAMPPLTVVEAVTSNVPTFTLEGGTLQQFVANEAAICEAIGVSLAFPWHTIPDQPGVKQSCSADVIWTIEVTWAQPPGQ